MNYGEIKQVLLTVDDPVQKLEIVMDLGKSLPAVPENAKCEEISGCASVVRICRDGDHFYGWADSALVRGLVAIIMAMIDGMSVDQIRNLDMRGEIAGLNFNLGAGRLNGLNSILGFFENL